MLHIIKSSSCSLATRQTPAMQWAERVCCYVQVVKAALPPGISMASAHSVLYIGKAVRVLQQPAGTARAAPGEPDGVSAHKGFAHSQMGNITSNLRCQLACKPWAAR